MKQHPNEVHHERRSIYVQQEPHEAQVRRERVFWWWWWRKLAADLLSFAAWLAVCVGIIAAVMWYATTR